MMLLPLQQQTLSGNHWPHQVIKLDNVKYMNPFMQSIFIAILTVVEYIVFWILKIYLC